MTPDAPPPWANQLAPAQPGPASATADSHAAPRARHAERAQAVFAYGILMRPDILAAITGRAPQLVPARLPGFRRYGLPHPGGEVFAAMAPAVGHAVAGVLILDVTDAELAAFDRVEEIGTGYYVRDQVQAETAAGALAAQAYLAGPLRRHTLVADWQPGAFDDARAAVFIRDTLPALLG